MKKVFFWFTVIYSLFTILYGGAPYLKEWIVAMMFLMVLFWAIIYKTFSAETWKSLAGKDDEGDFKF